MTVKKVPTSRRTVLGLIAAVSVGSLALGACSGGSSGGSSSGGKTTIVFWDDNGGPDRTPIYTELIKRFEAANPTIHVQYVGIPSDSAIQKYSTAITAGSPPDVGITSTSYLAQIVAQGAVVPLDDQLAKSSLKDKLVPGFLAATRGIAVDKKLYAVPFTSNSATLWYRSDWFKDAGLTPPATWDDFYTDADKLTDKSKNRFGFTIRGGAGSIYPLLQDLYAYSGITSFFDGNTSTIDAPANVEAITKLAALYKKDTPEADVNNGFPQMVAEFGGGSVAMMQHNLGSLSNQQKNLPGKFAAVPLPVGSAGVHTVVPDPFPSLAIFKKSKHQDADWKFIEFMLSKESNSYWNQKVGQIPANSDVNSDSWVTSTQSVQAGVKVLNSPDTKIVTPPLYLPEFAAITQVQMVPEWQKVLQGRLTPQAFATEFAGLMTKAQQAYAKRNSS